MFEYEIITRSRRKCKCTLLINCNNQRRRCTSSNDATAKTILKIAMMQIKKILKIDDPLLIEVYQIDDFNLDERIRIFEELKVSISIQIIMILIIFIEFS